MLASSRRGIVYPNTNRSDSADIPRDFLSVVQALEVDVIYGQGTLASRPTSTSGVPGIQGRIYCASDQTPKQFYWDNGTGWDAIGSLPYSDINRIGLLTNRPAANAVQSGTRYFATDQVVQYISDGINWMREGDPAGVTCDWFSNTVPAGWVAYDASNLPSAAGIYADLYAHLGNTVATPDTRGRPTIPKGTHVDHDTVLKSDGLAVGSRRMKHKHLLTGVPGHNLTLPNHAHNTSITFYDVNTSVNAGPSFGSNGVNGANVQTFGSGNPTSLPAINGGITLGTLAVGPQTGSEPTDGPSYITCGYKIAKL